MALNIKDPETDRLVRQLAAATGESLTTAVTVAVSERLERVTGVLMGDDLIVAVEEIVAHFRTLPVLDDRSAEEIVGYDEHGLPT